jgi:hypothetical protein
MSITIITQPVEESFVAASAPVWFRASTDLEETAYTITGIADNAGNVQLTVAASTGCEINNMLLITGGTTDYAYLNGRHNVLAVGTGTITINLTYVAASTGTPGVATIQLEKFSMGVDHQYDIDGDDTAISTHYVPFLSGIGLKDASRAVSGIFQSVFSLTDGWTSELNKCFYLIETAIYEAALTAEYARTPIDSEAVTWYAVRSTSIEGRILENDSYNKLLNGTTSYKVHSGTKVIMSMLTGLSDVSAYTTYTVGGTSYPVDTDFTTDNFKGNFVFTPVATSTGVVMYVRNSADDRISEQISITILPGCATKCYALYWLNRYGGYDVYEFAEAIEVTHTGNRTDLRGFEYAMGSLVDKDFSTEEWKTLRLIGRPEPAESNLYLRDLFTSQEIYNSDGNRVKLLSTEFMQTSRDNVTPEVTILVDRGVVIC